MHFNLPNQLALEVAGYDQTRKKLAAPIATENRNKNKRKTFPSGRPSNMFPKHVVKDNLWEQTVEQLNKEKAPDKVHLFTKPVFGQEPEPFAVVYYHRQLWVAAWLPPNGSKLLQSKDDSYIYGLTIAYRDTAAARKQCTDVYIPSRRTLGKCMFNQNDESMMLPRIKDGRSYWYRKTILMTKDDIMDGYTGNYWKDPNRSEHHLKSYGKTWTVYRTVQKWENQLAKDIPQFKGGSSDDIFTRLDPENNKFENIMSKYWSRPRWMGSETMYVHDVDNIIHILRKHFCCEYMQDVLSAKWFRSLVLNAMNDTKVIHENNIAQNMYDREALKPPYGILYQFLSSVNEIKEVYRDIDHNLLHSRFDWLSKIVLINSHNRTGFQWMQENLPVESFLNMLYQKYKQQSELDQQRSECGGYLLSADAATGQRHVYMTDWRDTYDMLCQCITTDRTDNIKPKRWRLMEWHDHLMAETWKISNANVNLPQKLFPQPIKVEQCNDGEDVKYSFLQPYDTHQLAAWGRAVRNCVGAGHGYADDIKKMRQLIILTMIDGQPRYTIQLFVNNGVMTVNQIGDIGNKRLSDLERSNVEDAFKVALIKREEQLT
tara:strand:+ start:609 stop:2408 length:1800 start_codon:yes stop_codon:yes gene_type:complete